MADKIVVLPEELEKMREFQIQFSELTSNYGKLAIARVTVKKQMKEIEQKFLDFAKSQQQLSLELANKYGEGVLDVETGEFQLVEN